MRMLFASLLSLAAAVMLTLWVKEDNGYILMGYGHWTLEGSLALFILADALLFLLLYIGLRMLAHLWSLPDQVREWSSRRNRSRSCRALTQGLVELAEGRGKSAEKRLIRYAAQSETPLLNYLAAARAAQLQGEDGRRDDYLHLAHESMPGANVAVGLTQAELQIAHQQYEQALATLMHLRSLAPKHGHVLMLLKRLYESLGDWRNLETLLPELRRQKIMDEEALHALELKIYRERLNSLEDDLPQLSRFWDGLSKPLRQDVDLLTDYVDKLVRLGEGRVAEPLVEQALQKAWHGELARRYGEIAGGDSSHRLSVAERWLQQRPEDPDLLLLLSRLSWQNRLWGKARSYLEASLSIRPDAQAYQELGLLLEQMDEPEKARECYRAGLRQAFGEPQREAVQINRKGLNQLPKREQSSVPSLVEGV